MDEPFGSSENVAIVPDSDGPVASGGNDCADVAFHVIEVLCVFTGLGCFGDAVSRCLGF